MLKKIKGDDLRKLLHIEMYTLMKIMKMKKKMNRKKKMNFLLCRKDLKKWSKQ